MRVATAGIVVPPSTPCNEFTSLELSGQRAPSTSDVGSSRCSASPDTVVGCADLCADLTPVTLSTLATRSGRSRV